MVATPTPRHFGQLGWMWCEGFLFLPGFKIVYRLISSERIQRYNLFKK